MRFIVDAQLPPALARALSSSGYQAAHVIDIGLEAQSDSDIWNYAIQNEAVIISKDEDFAHRLRQNPQISPTIVWLRIGNASRKNLLAWLSRFMPQIEAHIQKGEKLIELR